jgi:hypothetical protein
MKRRLSEFDPSEIAPVPVAAEEPAMRHARQRLADKIASKEAAAKQELERQLHPAADFDRRLAAARKAAPSEPIAFRFVPHEGGFAITAITEEDLAVPVSPKTPLKSPKV